MSSVGLTKSSLKVLNRISISFNSPAWSYDNFVKFMLKGLCSVLNVQHSKFKISNLFKI